MKKKRNPQRRTTWRTPSTSARWSWSTIHVSKYTFWRQHARSSHVSLTGREHLQPLQSHWASRRWSHSGLLPYLESTDRPYIYNWPTLLTVGLQRSCEDPGKEERFWMGSWAESFEGREKGSILPGDHISVVMLAFSYCQAGTNLDRPCSYICLPALVLLDGIAGCGLWER